MGVDYTSYAVIGFEIDPQQLYIKEQVRGCSCTVEFDKNKPPKFCSECGRNFMVEKENLIDGYDDFEESINGVKITFGTDRDTGFIGKIVAETMSSRCFGSTDTSFVKIEDDSIEQIKKDIKDALGKEIFETIVFEDTFGLHAVLRCCY